MADSTVTVHRIDRRGTIVQVNAAWLAFAKANRYPGDPASVIGHSLWSYISDLETRHIYKELVERARTSGSLRVPYRCDAPNLRRFLEMTIAFDATTDTISFTSRMLRTEARPRQPLLDPETVRLEEQFLRLCSWCKRGEYGAQEWIEIEQMVDRLGLFEQERMPRITHVICPACWERVRTVGSSDGEES